MVQVIKIDRETDEVETLTRIKAVGFLDDPNDLAQFLLAVMPLLWMWRKNLIWNIFSVYLPSAYLMYGIYLARSRGAVASLAVVALLAIRRRLGNAGSAVVTSLLFFGLLSIGFTGGRGISVGSGSDRLQLWSDGLTMFKGSPVWGVGYQAYSDFAHMNAHNSYIQCMAETGLLGYSLWLALLIINTYYLHQILNSRNQAALSPAILNAARCISLSFYAYLATSWFLSRAYVQTLYLLLGLTVVLHRIAAEQNPAFVPFQLPPKLPVIVLSTACASVFVFYFVVNLR